MIRLTMCLAALYSFLAIDVLVAQGLEERVAAVRDGYVRVSFTARQGVCGSGRNVHMPRTGNDNWEPNCSEGPVMVLLERHDGETTEIETYVGGRWRQRDDATDIGRVPAPEAARFLLSLARTPSRAADDAIMPASLADSITVSPELARIGRDRSLRNGVRKAALFWGAQLGDDSMVDVLRDIMRSDPEDELREHAVFALSQHGSDRAIASLRSVVEDGREDVDVRKNAIFWLGQRNRDITYLIDMYDRLEELELKKQLLFVYAQRRGDDDALDMLMRVASEDGDRDLRGSAIFWLGQTKDPRAVEFLARLIG